MYVYMYIYMYTQPHACAYACMHRCMHIYAHACACALIRCNCNSIEHDLYYIYKQLQYIYDHMHDQTTLTCTPCSAGIPLVRTRRTRYLQFSRRYVRARTRTYTNRPSTLAHIHSKVASVLIRAAALADERSLTASPQLPAPSRGSTPT